MLCLCNIEGGSQLSEAQQLSWKYQTATGIILNKALNNRILK